MKGKCPKKTSHISSARLDIHLNFPVFKQTLFFDETNFIGSSKITVC